MAIDTKGRQLVDYFVGIEVENTAMKGERTLFVVGIKPVEEIIALAEKHNLKHIYFFKLIYTCNFIQAKF